MQLQELVNLESPFTSLFTDTALRSSLHYDHDMQYLGQVHLRCTSSRSGEFLEPRQLEFCAAH